MAARAKTVRLRPRRHAAFANMDDVQGQADRAGADGVVVCAGHDDHSVFRSPKSEDAAVTLDHSSNEP